MAVPQIKLDLAEEMLGRVPAPEGEAEWAVTARAAARARFAAMGGPSRRDEYWKYTDPARLTAQPAPAREADPASSAPVFADALTVVFANGVLRADLSDDFAAEGLEIAPLGDALRAGSHFAGDLFGALEADGQAKVERPLAALNTATVTEGLAIRVTGAVARPVQIRWIGMEAAMARVLLRVEAGASATVLEAGTVGNSVMEVDLAEGGALAHVRDQSGDAERISASHIFTRIGAEARFKSFTLTADGALTRNEIVFDIVGDGASAHVAGAILAGGAAHVDNTVFITHDAVDCESRQVFKTVLEGEARGVFQGKIFVKPGAQKTDGYQIAQSVLLSDTAEFDVKPELEIYADDVACSHGSTTGALDEMALYYLRARGIPHRDAEALLVAAFAEEAIAEIGDVALEEIMRGRVATWMDAR